MYERGGEMSHDPLDVPALAREQLRTFRDLLITWNRRFNLTAIDTPDGIDRLLIGDALMMLPALDDAIAAVAASRRGNSAKRSDQIQLIDIGTGAGFPGMVLKIARPELDVTLVDATGKKVGFLQHIIQDLNLSGVQAVHGRAEELAHSEDFREQFDIVTARAVAALPTLLEFCIPFINVGGHAIFPKGANIESELEEGDHAARTLGARIVSSGPVRMDGAENVTRLVIAVKLDLTPTRFPRRGKALGTF
jgi:16S rRNA (guanine527-N7)-methyltransferase